MYVTKYKMRENYSLSVEDFEKIYGRKPEVLNVTLKNDEKFYKNEYKSEEAFFGENNVYKVTMISLFGELRNAYKMATDKNTSVSDKRQFSKEIRPIIEKIEKHVEKTFNIKKCYMGLVNDLNAWCYPLCIDKNLVMKKDKKTVVNNKLKVSLEDIVETKSGYKYKNPDGKIYCIAFGVNFFNEKNGKPLFTDEECAAIITHELGHAMQQAICSINENLASVYIHEVFKDVYKFLNPFVMIGSLGLSIPAAIFTHFNYKSIRDDDPEDVGSDVITQVIAANQKDFDREKIATIINEDSNKVIKSLPTKKEHKVFKAFIKFFVFVFGGAFKIIADLLMSIIGIPQNIYALSQSKYLKKNRRFEQFADIYTAAYGLGPAQASALAKIGNAFGFKQDYGLLSITNYIPIFNIVTGVTHYMNFSLNQLIAGYPDTTGRMAAMYKSLQTDLNNNKDLSTEDKEAIKAEIDTMNEIFNQYVYDWSPKGFVYALWHKITFKSLKNTKSDASKNVIEALEEMNKESKFKNANNSSSDSNTREIDSQKLMSAMFSTIKSLKSNYNKSNDLTKLISVAESITNDI